MNGDGLARPLGAGAARLPTARSGAVHRSPDSPQRCPVPNNERLEFLGDAVLNLVVARAPVLCTSRCDGRRRGPGAACGRRRGQSPEPLAAGGGVRSALGEVLQLGSGELKTGGFRRSSILADALGSGVRCRISRWRHGCTAQKVIERVCSSERVAALPAPGCRPQGCQDPLAGISAVERPRASAVQSSDRTEE